jgi:hypothetical protein
LYPVAWALALRGETQAALGTRPEEMIDTLNAYVEVLGDGPTGWLALAVLLGGWSLARGFAGRRITSLYTLGFFLIACPLLAPLVGAHLTGGPTYWRIFWLIPFPALFGAALCRALDARGGGAVGRVLFVVLLALVAGAAPRLYTFARENSVWIGPPGPRIPERVLSAARALAASAPRGSAVLAGEEVAAWVVTLHEHPQPLVVRELYLESRADLPRAEVNERLLLARMVSGSARPADAGPRLERAIARYGLRAVCLWGRARQLPELRRALTTARFQIAAQSSDFEIWVPRESVAGSSR